MRVLLLSDTHAPRFWKRVPDALVEPLRQADVILHAGDVCTAGVLHDLAAYAAVHAVLGNNDGPDVAAWPAPHSLELELEGVRIAMIHIAGPKTGRAARMRRRFPRADLVVFGHSHIPWDTQEDGQRLVNPGSPTDKRRQPVGTYGVLELQAGTIERCEILPVLRSAEPGRPLGIRSSPMSQP